MTREMFVWILHVKSYSNNDINDIFLGGERRGESRLLIIELI